MGYEIAERLHVMALHPLAQLRFTNCLMPKRNLLGTSSDGVKLAMRTLDIFYASVVASIQSFARRTLGEALAHLQ